MTKESLYVFGILLLIVVSESRVLVRRGLPKDGSSGNGELPVSLDTFDKDKRLGLGPGIWDSPSEGDDSGVFEYDDTGYKSPGIIPPDYHYGKPGRDDNEIDKGKPGIRPEKFPSDADHDEGPVGKPGVEEDEKDEDVDEELDVDKSGDAGFYEPFDGKENPDKSAGDDKGFEPPLDEGEDKSVHKDEGDKDEKEPDVEDDKGDDGDKEEHEPADGEDKENGPEESDEDKEHGPKGDEDKEEPEPKDDENEEDHEPKVDEDKHVPKEDGEESSDEHDKEDDEISAHGGEEGFLSGGSIFDTPFFNLEKVQQYFSQLDRALGQVFRQTLDEALLLNGTYANTTEEEVEIDGKKYIVQKSLIKGADNHSSIYVEALSTKPKSNDTEVTIH